MSCAGSSKLLHRSSQHCSFSGRTMSRVAKMMFACPMCGWILSFDIMIRYSCTQACGSQYGIIPCPDSVLETVYRQSDSAKFTAFYAFPLVETVELLVRRVSCERLYYLRGCCSSMYENLLSDQWLRSCIPGFGAPSLAGRCHETIRRTTRHGPQRVAHWSCTRLPTGMRRFATCRDPTLGRAGHGIARVRNSACRSSCRPPCSQYAQCSAADSALLCLADVDMWCCCHAMATIGWWMKLRRHCSTASVP